MTDGLLDGPRGRRLCLEYAARDPHVAEAAGYYAFHHPEGSSTVIAFSSDVSPAPVPDPGVAGIAALLRAASTDPSDLTAASTALRVSVESARGWQEPDTIDALAAEPQVIEALGPLATNLAAAYADEWARGRSEQQWAVLFRLAGSGGVPTGAATRVEEWDSALRPAEEHARREWPTEPAARWSGEWWSVPVRLLSTRGSVPAALDLVEDSLGDEVATIVPLTGEGSTLEIDGADDWAALCRRYPVEVTASRRHDWFRVTGRDERWLQPDWRRVAQEWDAVHLTTRGYLTAATRFIAVDDEYATVMAGWAPDSTVWLRDSTLENGPRQQWRRDHPAADWTRDHDGQQ